MAEGLGVGGLLLALRSDEPSLPPVFPWPFLVLSRPGAARRWAGMA